MYRNERRLTWGEANNCFGKQDERWEQRVCEFVWLGTKQEEEEEEEHGNQALNNL